MRKMAGVAALCKWRMNIFPCKRLAVVAGETGIIARCFQESLIVAVMTSMAGIAAAISHRFMHCCLGDYISHVCMAAITEIRRVINHLRSANKTMP